MPIFEIQTSEGRFEVDAPSEQAAVSALSGKGAGETSLSGIAKSAGAGFLEGGASLLGLPADALDLVARGSDALLGTKAGEESGPIAQKFGSGAMLKRLENATGGLYKSQGGVEELARTAGSFWPGMIGGAASIPVKLGTRVALPAVAVEGAKALTEGTSLEPYAPVAAGLAGLAGGIGIERALTRGAGVAPRPTRAQIDNETNALYNRPELGQVRIHGNEAARFVDQTQVGIDRGSIAGMRGAVPAHDADRTFRVLDRLRTPGVGAGPHEVRIADLDSVRKILGEYAGETGTNFRPTPNARAAMAARTAIDDFLANLNQGQLSAGNAQTASAILREARASAQAGFKIAKVERILEQARNTAAATHSGGNLENEIYKKVRTYLNDPQKHLRGWSRDEIAALRRVLPSLAESVLRRGGKLLGGGGGLGQLASGSAGGAIFGFPGMVALPAAGMAMNRAGGALANRRVGNLMDVLASGAPSYAPHRQAFQQSLQGPGLLGRLPPPGQASLYTALMAQRPQPVQ